MQHTKSTDIYSDCFAPWGKRVLVTGDRGIGLGAAEALASAECEVAISYESNADDARRTCDRLAQEFNVRTHPLQADVSDPHSARSFVRQAARLMGGLDIAICNAGICDFKPILDVTDEDWLRHINTNLSGSFYVAQESAKIMVEQKAGGRIIFTSSVGAFRSNGTQTHYCATKGGQHLLMQGMALELGPHRITVNSVAPGWIHTDINDAASRDPSITGPWIKAHAPVGRLGAVKDLKAAFLFLASHGASYVNGTAIVVDGGWLAQL